MPKNAISIEHLTKVYHTGRHPVHALDDCSFCVQRGKLVGLLGHNGAGKSTLIRILCTLITPCSGSARVWGHDVTTSPMAVRRAIAVVSSDERSFHGRLTARQNLMFFAALQELSASQAHRRIQDTLEMMGLGQAADRRVQTFSSGMRQRLSMVRALLNDPPVILLDEPTKSMDVQSADVVRSLVRDVLVNQHGKTVLYTTHDLYEMDSFCDRIVVLDHGRVAAQGTIAELLQTLPEQITYRLKASAVPEALLAESRRKHWIINVEPQSPETEGPILHITFPGATPPLDDVWHLFAKHQVRLLGIETSQRDALGRILRHYARNERPDGESRLS